MVDDPGVRPPPYALSIGLCDWVYRDPGTGKRFILGCVGAIHAIQFPATHPILCVYADLTNGRGVVNIKMQIVDVDEERPPVWVQEMPFEFPDPRAVGEFDLVIGAVTFPEHGEYRLQVFADNQFVIERGLLLNKLEPRA